MKLLVSQKNRLFDVFESAGFSPQQFLYSEKVGSDHKSYVEISFKNESYYFKVYDSRYHAYLVYSSPGKSTIKDNSSFDLWEGLEREFNNWLSYLKREISIEDKWKRLESEIKNLNLTQETNDSKFSVKEFEILSSRISHLKTNFNKIDLSPNQVKQLELKMDYLLEEAKHMNKFDWKSLFVGTIISLIIQLSLSQEQGKQLWDFIKNIFTNYFLP